jgi:hypothetical protein
MALSVHRSEVIGSINCQGQYYCLVAGSIEVIEGNCAKVYVYMERAGERYNLRVSSER